MTMRRTAPVIVVLSLMALTSGSPLDILYNDQGFTISLGNVTVFNHTDDSPIVYVGTGSTSFPEFSGNFFIADYTQERIALTPTSMNCNMGDCSLNFSRDATWVQLLTTTSQYQSVAITVNATSGDFDRMWLRMSAQPGEECWGGGEQFSYFNLRHRGARGVGENVFPMWTSEQGVGRNKSTLVTFEADVQGRAGGDYHTTYFPQPSYVSSGGYSFHHAGDNYAVMDFSHDDFNEVMIVGTPGAMYINNSPRPAQLVTDMTSLLGRMPALPGWIQGGAVLGVQGGTATMLSKYQYAKQHSIPVSALWIQDWSGKQDTPFGSRVNWNWKWDPTWYPGLDTAIKNLTKEGVRVMAYINPNLDHRGDLFKEAAAKGFLVKNSTGGIYYRQSLTFVLGTVDLTNPQAFDWYKNDVIKKNMIDLGLGGWMADFGEYLPADAKMANGQSGQEVHNAWPRLWARLNREAVEEAGKLGEVVFFMRSGFSGISNYTTLMWAGDQNVDFSLADGLHSAIIGSLSMATVGPGLTHFDIGGYTTFGAQGLVRTEELLLRSAEVAAFTPVFRTHEGNQPQYNVQWYTNTSIQAFSRVARIFSALKNYRMTVVQSVADDGMPAQRPMQLHFPGLMAPYTQYMFGPDLLVCPVYMSKVTTQDCVLPATTGFSWIHMWTLAPYPGSQTVTVPAPLGSPPVFYRSDSKFKDIFEKIKDIKEMAPADVGIMG